MFFREKKTKTTPVLQLVESKRHADGKVRQNILVSLGGCWVPDPLRKAVAKEVSLRLEGFERFLPDDPELTHWTRRVFAVMEKAGKLPAVTCRELEGSNDAAELDKVRVEKIEHENGTQLGPCLVLLAAWRALQLDAVLEDCGFSLEQQHTAKAAVFNRLVAPGSENNVPHWLRTTALDELLDVQTDTWAEDRFYRISDRLLRHRSKLETHLRQREESLFKLKRTILLYDLTNSYFEGQAEANDLAQYGGKSKEKRNDCPQIAIGVVLDADGFLLTHKVFRGNMHDCKTLVDAVDKLEHACRNNTPPTVVLDSGIATEENLKYLRKKNYHYIVNASRQSRKKFAQDFLKKDSFTKVSSRTDKAKTPVFVRRLDHADETIVLCRSQGRQEKEAAIIVQAEKTLIVGLQKLQKRLDENDPKLKLVDGATLVNRAIGRLAKTSTRASKLYDMDYDHEARKLHYQRRPEAWDRAQELLGCYYLRSSLDLPDEELWELYMTLTRVEDSFKALKGELGLRPFYHKTKDRCKGHIWLTILAYHLLHWVEYSLAMNGYNGTWRHIKTLLATHCYCTLIIPTENCREKHIRRAGRPNAEQKLIYDVLGIDWTELPVQRRIYRSNKP